jgi:hypothetical protein
VVLLILNERMKAMCLKNVMVRFLVAVPLASLVVPSAQGGWLRLNAIARNGATVIVNGTIQGNGNLCMDGAGSGPGTEVKLCGDVQGLNGGSGKLHMAGNAVDGQVFMTGRGFADGPCAQTDVEMVGCTYRGQVHMQGSGSSGPYGQTMVRESGVGEHGPVDCWTQAVASEGRAESQMMVRSGGPPACCESSTSAHGGCGEFASSTTSLVGGAFTEPVYMQTNSSALFGAAATCSGVQICD